MNFSVFQFSQLQFSFLFLIFLFHFYGGHKFNSFLRLFESRFHRISIVALFLVLLKNYAQLFALALYHSVSVWCVKCAPTSVCARTAFPIPRMFIHHPTLPFCLSFGEMISLKRTRMRIQIKFEALTCIYCAILEESSMGSGGGGRSCFFVTPFCFLWDIS